MSAQWMQRAAVAAATAAIVALTSLPAAAAPSPTSGATAAPTASAPVGGALAARVLDAPILTLPAGDGVRDGVRLRITSGAAGAVSVTASKGKRSIAIRDRAVLSRARTGWQRTVQVPVRRLSAGGWRLVVRRADDRDVTASTRVRVGSGRPAAVVIAPAARTVYPYRDGALDAVAATVTATDETGAPLPVTGALRLDDGKRHRTRSLQGGAARIPVTGLPLGRGLLTADVRTPGGTSTRTARVTLAPTAVGALRLARSADTVQPVVDGLLDSVVLTTSGAASGGSPAKVSGVLTITGPTGRVVRSFPVGDGSARTFTWNGRVQGAIVPGRYRVSLRMHGPQGPASVRTKVLTVSRAHLPYRVRDLFRVAVGDQQGLAVHAGQFYVATDVGAGSSRVDVWGGNGKKLRSLGVLPIGHGATLAFSTTTGRLYAANGGPTSPTTITEIDPAATDPASAVVRTIDLSALGPNGMAAVDDAGGRLLVFAGTKGHYTLSAVGFDGTVQRTAPIAITGLPQGLQMVDGRLWVYTSLKGRNHLAEYAVTDDAVVASSTGGGSFDLMNPGEGEGFAFSDGALYVGAHGANRIGVLVPVADE